MSIFGLLFIILILGFITYAVYRWAPIPAGFKAAVYFVCIAIVIMSVLYAFGIMPDLNATVPRVH
jgi:hypothetical protein